MNRLNLLQKKTKVLFHSEIIESHSITKTIVSYSKSKKIDLIVMGAHGITGWDNRKSVATVARLSVETISTSSRLSTKLMSMA